MDTPESDEKFFNESTDINRNLVEGQGVTLIKDVSETDQFNRLLRYIFVGDTFVNYELVAQGYASAATYPPDVACSNLFVETEQKARDSELGLWAPMPTATASPTVAPTQAASNCDPSYPTVCIPPYPPDLNCGDIPYRRFTVLPPDPHGFDGDHDGIGCESG